VGIGLSWVGFAVWVLTHRRPLLSAHRIVAGRMAVTFTSLFVLGTVALGMTTSAAAAYAATALGLAMLAGALAVLRHGHVTTARLRQRRAMLERELGKSAT
jgi:hypothetical protein